MLAFFSNPHISGEIRARQIAKYLNMKLDPESGYENDIHILIKTLNGIDRPHRHIYIDVIDEIRLRFSLKGLNDFGVIAFSEKSRDHLYKCLHRDIIYIPQHHCNFENQIRENRDIKTVGFIGGRLALWCDIEKIEQALNEIGLNFKPLIIRRSINLKREDVVNFYKQIDIQIYYRTGKRYPSYLYKDGLKFLNAASFRIPTVAVIGNTDTQVMHDGKMIIVNDADEIVRKCKQLKNDISMYDDHAQSAYEVSKNYHIDQIAPLYLELDRKD